MLVIKKSIVFTKSGNNKLIRLRSTFLLLYKKYLNSIDHRFYLAKNRH